MSSSNSIFEINRKLTANSQANKHERLSIFDLARVIAMIFMVQGHSIDALGSPSAIDISQFPWDYWHIIRGFTAPIFLTISGIVQVFANKRNADGHLVENLVFRRIRLALILIFIGYMLGLPVTHVSQLFSMTQDHWELFLRVNILQLIGVSLILIVTMFAFIKNNKTLALVTLFFSLLLIIFAPNIAEIDWYAKLPLFLASYFSTAKSSIFTISPFTAYMLFGVAFGCYVSEFKKGDTNVFIRKSTFIVAVITFLLALIWFDFSKGIIENIATLNRNSPGLTFSRISFTFFNLSLLTFIYPFTKKIEKYYSILGKRSLYIYVLHLFVIFGTPLTLGLVALGQKSFSLTNTILLAIFVEITAIGITFFIDYSLKNWLKIKYFYFILILVYLGFVFLG